MAQTINLNLFTPHQLSSMLEAVKTEYTQRITGKVINANVAGQSYGLQTMSNDEIAQLGDALAAKLGLSTEDDSSRGRPDFSRGGIPYGRGTL